MVAAMAAGAMEEEARAVAGEAEGGGGESSAGGVRKLISRSVGPRPPVLRGRPPKKIISARSAAGSL